MDTHTVRPTRKRGRRDQGMHEQLHVNVPLDLKEWVMSQPEEASPFVRRLIEEERKRREQRQA